MVQLQRVKDQLILQRASHVTRATRVATSRDQTGNYI